MTRILSLTLLTLALLGIAPASAQNCSGQPAANTVCAGPTGGGNGLPGFRPLTAADIPPFTLPITINGNTVTPAITPPATTYLYIIGANNAIPRVTIDAFVSSTVGAVYDARMARGTAASPTAVLSNDALLTLGAFGFQGGGAYSVASQMSFLAAENFSSGHNGQKIQFTTVPVNTATPVVSFVMQASGGTSIGPTNFATDPGINNLLAGAIIVNAGSPGLSAGTGSIGGQGATGLNLAGSGSVSDLKIINSSGGTVCTVPTATQTWSCGNLIVAPTVGDAISVAGLANTNNRVLNTTQSGPISGSVAGPINLNLITVSSYNAAVNAGSEFGDFGWWTSALTAFRVNFTIGGANLGNTEPFAGIVGHVRFTSAGTVASGTDMEGVLGLVYANASSTNTLAMEGIVGAAVADAGSNIKVMVGVFAETDIINAGTVTERRGVAIVSQGTATASGHDAGIDFSATGGGFKTLISVNTAGASPVQTTGNFIDSTGAFTIANFVTLPNMTVTGNIFNFAKLFVRGTDGFTSIGPNVTPDSLLTVMGNTAATVAPLAGNLLHVVGTDGALAVVTIDAFGSGAGQSPIIIGRTAAGTLASKSAVGAGVGVGSYGFQAWDGSAYSTIAEIDVLTGNAQTGSDHSGLITFSTTPLTSTTKAEAGRFQPSGCLSVGYTTACTIGVIAANNGFKSGASVGVTCNAGISATTGRSVNGIITAC